MTTLADVWRTRHLAPAASIRHTDDLDRLDAWFGQQEFERILCIGGNHDFDMQARAERGPELVDWAYYLDDDALRNPMGADPATSTRVPEPQTCMAPPT